MSHAHERRRTQQSGENASGEEFSRSRLRRARLYSNASLLAGDMSIRRVQNEARLPAAVRERSPRSRNVDSNRESGLNCLISNREGLGTSL